MTATQAQPSGSEAAAILLMLLAEEEAAEVLSLLQPEEVQHLGGAMFNVANVSEDQVDDVVDLFVESARARTTIGFGANQQIRGIMERALGNEKAEKILSRITPATSTNALDSLRWMDPEAIAKLVGHEHPQIAALVLAHLDPAKAADVLQLLDENLQAEVIYRVATLGPVTAEAIEDLEQLLNAPTSKGATSSPATKRGGASEAAKIVNNARTAAEQRIIKALAKLDKNLARSIEDEMFIFDNLLALDDKSMGALLRTVENDILVVALKGADERMKTKMFGCMSSRAAQSIQDEIQDRGPMRLAEVQEAQKEMLAVARRLAAEGTIMLGGKDDDYV